MKNSTLAKSGLALAAGTTLALTAALPASAHVSVSASTTAAGAYSVLSFAVPHGCDGSPTTRLAIELPAEILGATPTVVAGWEATKVTAEIEPVADAHGNEVSERVAEVVYTATDGGLAEGFRQVFAVQVQLPELDAGTELGFPVTQSCAEGETVWDGDTLPVVTLSAAEPEAHDHGAEAPAAASDGVDVLARVLAIGGLAVGAAGIVTAIVSRRRAKVDA